MTSTAFYGPGRGPIELGRWALVRTGQPSPAAWHAAARVVVPSKDAAVARRLLDASHSRTPLVLEIDDALYDELRVPYRTDAPLHRVGARREFTGEQLWHQLTANVVDHRGGSPVWALLDLALQAGARPADGVGDVVLPDGRPVWLDGGPVRCTPAIDGVSVLHRVSVEHGHLTTPTFGPPPDGLAADQLAAVVHTGGAARIIAPAGSGKTRVLTERARHLLRQWKLPATAITVVAFNKRAQEEITERTADLPGLRVFTLNALGLGLLNTGSATRVTTVDEPTVRRLLSRLVTVPRVRNADPIAPWIEALSMARLGLVDPEVIDGLYDGAVSDFATVFPQYRELLARENSVDFDEQIHLAIERLLGDPALRQRAQQRCRIMLVDEFQDLTPAHLLLIRILAGPDGAVFGVGDDDQTIYGYNGADPEWLIDFAEIFPGAGDHPLHTNYRCPGGVVTAADTLLRHNVRRVDKTIVSSRPTTAGFEVRPPADDTVPVTVDVVRARLAAGATPSDVAVLTRVNSLLAPLQVALAAEGIPVVGGVGEEFVARVAVRSSLAWLRLASGRSWTSTDLDEALRRPSRSLAPRLATWVCQQRSVADLRRLAGRMKADRDANTIDTFATDIERLASMAAAGADTARLLEEIRTGLGLAGAVAGLDGQRRGMNRSAQGDDLTALAQLAALHPDAVTFGDWLTGAVSARRATSGVALSTVHRVKGLEWPTVVVHHVDHEQFPHRLADDVEEERRLFHVAITRARDLTVVVPSATPSPFVEECRTTPPPRQLPNAEPFVMTKHVAAPGRRPPTTPTTPTPSSRTAPTPAVKVHLGAADGALFEDLKRWRRTASAGKPAFTVFADATLAEIATARPHDLVALGRIKGVGPAKLAAHGESVLEIVARHPAG